jgi:hypothetical protein
MSFKIRHLFMLLALCMGCIHSAVLYGQNEQKMFWALNKNQFLLDQLPNVTPSVAYSVRRLKNTYTGFALKIRRDDVTTDPEADVAFDANGVVSANSMVTITIAGSSGYSVGAKVVLSTFCSGKNAYVVTWYDQSGNGNHASQATITNQPVFVKSGLLLTENGNPTIEFTGVHSSINLTLASLVSLTNGSLLGVAKLLTPAASSGFADNGTYSYNINTWNNTGKFGVTQYGATDVPSTLSYTTSLDAFAWSKSSSNTYVELNTRTSSSTAALNIPIAVKQVYGNAVSGTVLRIAEFIITPYLTTSQRGNVFVNQKTFFGTP